MTLDKGEFTGGIFPGRGGDEQIFGWQGESPHPPSTENPVPWEDIFKLSVSAAAIEFYEWVQVETDVYILHCKYQDKPHLSPWFSVACAAAIVTFFICTNRINLLNLM